jgi:dihydroorotate dehydrogenase electron transfer subunit
MTTAAPTTTTGTVVARRPAGPYHLLSIAAPDVVAAAQPGQFVSIALDAPGTLLRRPFAIAGVQPDAGVLDLVVAVVGTGTRWLVHQPVSTALGVVGPLGIGFAPPPAGTPCVLVGGGYGVAALEWLGRRLLAAGHRVDLCSGAATARALYPVARVPDDTLAVREATEDGSRGRAGLVTDALRDRLAEDDRPALFACGPMGMLAAVAAVAAEHGSACQVAVEEHMACSVGVCMTCVVPTADGYVRACIDGPVMDAATIVWGAVR